MIKKSGLAVVLSLFYVLNTSAQSYEQHTFAQDFIDEMSYEHGFPEDYLQKVLAQAKHQQSILDAISRPAERVKPWKEYRPIFLTPQRIEQGVRFWQTYEQALTQAEAQYGVLAEFIVAIIGVETMYGGNTGRYRVLDALTTLAFDYPPRAPFFRGQLKEFLLMVREEQLEPTSLTGSYAGAMGLPQFMPGSFRAFAVDFNGDGQINIWNDAQDAIGSVANYLVKHGWQADEAVVIRAELRDAQAERQLTGSLTPNSSFAQLEQSGWQPDQNIKPDTMLTAFKLDGENGVEYWLGLPNFQAITKYNRSEMYAMAVTQLAQKLAEEVKK